MCSEVASVSRKLSWWDGTQLESKDDLLDSEFPENGMLSAQEFGADRVRVCQMTSANVQSSVSKFRLLPFYIVQRFVSG